TALAGVAGGVWLGQLLRRPAATACLVLTGVALPVLAWSLIQRSFERFAAGQATQRLSMPFGYPNALGLFCVLALLPALWAAPRGRGGPRGPALAPRSRGSADRARPLRAAADRVARLAAGPRGWARRLALAGATPPPDRCGARRRGGAGDPRRDLGLAPARV